MFWFISIFDDKFNVVLLLVLLLKLIMILISFWGICVEFVVLRYIVVVWIVDVILVIRNILLIWW